MAFTYISFQWLTNSKSDTKEEEKKKIFFHESCDNGFAINLQQIEMNA